VIRVNLIKEEGKGRAEMKMLLALYAFSAVLVLGGSYFISSYQNNKLVKLTSEEKKLDVEKKILKEKTRDVESLETEKEALKNKLLIISRLKKSKTGPVQVLDKINIALPEKSWLLKINETSNKGMEISGLALENDSVSAFAEELSESEFFSKVNIVEVVQEDFQDIKVSKFQLATDVNFDGVKSEVTTDLTKDAEGQAAPKSLSKTN
jgi:type IV pilus assembly protein PilN